MSVNQRTIQNVWKRHHIYQDNSASVGWYIKPSQLVQSRFWNPGLYNSWGT